MAVTVTRQTLNDGPRNLVVKCHLVSDDATQVSDQSLIDISSYSPAPADVKIVGIKASLFGFSAMLHWDATANVDIVALPEAEDINQCFRRFGGLVNNAGAGVTGDILFSVNGIAADDEGTIILEMVKRGVDA